MKSFKQHICEKLKVSVKNTTKHTLFPETKDELKQIIKDITRTYPTYKMFKSEKKSN